MHAYTTVMDSLLPPHHGSWADVLLLHALLSIRIFVLASTVLRSIALAERSCPVCCFQMVTCGVSLLVQVVVDVRSSYVVPKVGKWCQNIVAPRGVRYGHDVSTLRVLARSG